MSRVLLVDDEPGVRFAVEQVLLDSGLEVETCDSGKEALERLKKAE